jgi:hypothetical protein
MRAPHTHMPHLLCDCWRCCSVTLCVCVCVCAPPTRCYQGVHRLLGRNASHELAKDALAPNQYVAHGVATNARGGFDVLLPEAKAAPAPTEDEELAEAVAAAAAAAGVSTPTVGTPKLPTRFSVEEVTSMILTHARQFSEVVADSKIKEVLLVVPSFTTQNERLAIEDAVSLTGMSVSVARVLSGCVGG